MNVSLQLDETLRSAGIPIVGVSVGADTNRETWSVQFLQAATEAQRLQAAQILSTFDPADPAVVAARQLADAQASSRQKDLLAILAWAVRARNVTTWNALTLAQKKAAVLAEADNWRDLRIFIEQNL